MGEGREGAIWFSGRPRFVRLGSYQIALMLVVMTVKAKQLPVAAVRGIVVIVVVLVMHCELMKTLAGKFTSAQCADPGVDLQRLFPIAPLPLFTDTPALGDYPVQPVCFWLHLFRRHMLTLGYDRRDPARQRSG